MALAPEQTVQIKERIFDTIQDYMFKIQDVNLRERVSVDVWDEIQMIWKEVVSVAQSFQLIARKPDLDFDDALADIEKQCEALEGRIARV